VKIKNLTTLLLSTLTAIAVAGCINQGGSSPSATGGGTGTSVPTGSSSKSAPTAITAKRYTMTKATATPPSDASTSGDSTPSSAPNFTLMFDANNTNFLTDVCQVQSGGSGSSSADPSKACKCRYTWILSNLSDASVVTRTVDTDPTQVTSFQIQCPGPDVYYDDTEIPNNSSIKIELIPDTDQGNNSGFTTNSVTFPKQPISVAGDFRDAEGRSYRNIYHYACFDRLQKNLSINQARKNAKQNSATNAQIQAYVANSFTLSGSGGVTSFSGQSYYYDFYIRSNEIGTINPGNASMVCPRVNVNGIPSYYPLDSQFALALQASTDFPVPINANIILSSSTGAGSNGTTLGYAAKPNADGTCPAFADDKGRVRRTFRIRMYSAIFPLRYDADGSLIEQSQRSNTIFVLDRPVDKVSQDVLKPITRLGPKPCPFSYSTAQFGQKCMSDASLTGWSIDGTQINSNKECPVYPPVPEPSIGDTSPYLKSDGTIVIRPYKPFVPYYLENTRFKACAFQSSAPVDPEMVVVHDESIYPAATGPKDFYCSKYYPAAGLVLPSATGAPIADKIPGDCDQSMSANAIKTNRTYACLRTYDSTNPTLLTPKAGCCQICSGPDCRAYGGGVTFRGRNAAFSPPADTGNPSIGIKTLPRAIPNQTGGGGCYDPYED